VNSVNSHVSVVQSSPKKSERSVVTSGVAMK
jgi:hypothetical protein